MGQCHATCILMELHSQEEDMTRLWCADTMSGANSRNSLPLLSEDCS